MVVASFSPTRPRRAGTRPFPCSPARPRRRRTHPPRACQDRPLSRWTRPYPCSPARHRCAETFSFPGLSAKASQIRLEHLGACILPDIPCHVEQGRRTEFLNYLRFPGDLLLTDPGDDPASRQPQRDPLVGTCHHHDLVVERGRIDLGRRAVTFERLDEALIRHGFYELLPEGVENLDAGLPLVIHHLDRVGHDGVRH